MFMAVDGICTRNVVIVEKTATIQQAAQLMREHHVGCLVVTDDSAGKQSPKGLLPIEISC
jgi:predicted transcriptional regulator